MALSKYTNTPVTTNQTLLREEHEAISALKQRRDSIIKPADKGEKIVLWPVNQYPKEAHRRQSDRKYYQHQTSNHIHELAAQITAFLTHLYARNALSKDEFEYLLSPSPVRTPQEKRCSRSIMRFQYNAPKNL